MFHLILKFIMCTFLLGFGALSLLLKFDMMVCLHLLYSLFLVFLQVLQLDVIMLLLGLKHAEKTASLPAHVRFVAWLFFSKVVLTFIS